jgi:hypothetical protein
MKSALLGASLLLLGVASSSALADTTFAKGTIGVPSSFSTGNTILNSNPTSVTLGSNTYLGTSFYDDYTFTVTDGSASSITSSIDLGSFLGISGLRARIYTGSTHQTGAVVPGTLVEAWGTTMTAGGFTSTNVVLAPITISAGTYTLQIAGAATGSTGGSYGGVFNISPVPETDTYAMLIAGLGVVSLIARRKSIAYIDF